MVRYRRTSVKTLLGVTKAKSRIKKPAGVYEITRIVKAPTNLKRRVKRRLGYESPAMRFLRFLLGKISFQLGPMAIRQRWR